MDENENCLVFFDRLLSINHTQVTKNDWLIARGHWNIIRKELVEGQKPTTNSQSAAALKYLNKQCDPLYKWSLHDEQIRVLRQILNA